MPIIKSAKKRMKQTAASRTRNQNTKRSLRGEVKTLMAAIEKKDGKKAAEQLKKVQSNLDKAVKKNVMKKNTASRRLTSLSAKVKAINLKSKPNSSSSQKAKTAKPKTSSKKSVEK